MRVIEKAILKTLVYADIFDYPLKRGEIWKYLINHETRDTKHETRISELKKTLKYLIRREIIETERGFYFLRGQEKIVNLRKRREKWSREKVKKAQKIANLLKIMPTVKLVGISGALAMENSDEDDDIDLFIITSSGRLWLTRFLVTILVELTGQRRKPLLKYKIQDTRYKIQDKICLNMFVDEDHLAIPPKERNLFTSHEVVQMKPLWSRNGVYERFLGENRWVRRWLANSIKNEKLKIKNKKHKLKIKKENFFNFSISQFLNFLEKALMIFQIKYMSHRRTIEKISPGRILFHPEDKGKWVLKNFKLKMKKLR